VTFDQARATRCNIGPDEIARRRLVALALTVVTLMTATLLVTAHAPAGLRLLIWPLASAAAVTWLQVLFRFCVAFGALGLENFGGLGREVPVDPTLRRSDRRRALRLILLGGVIGLLVAIAVLAIPA
jgi:hypothetical protein